MKNNPRWMELSALAAAEEDPEKMLALIKEINDLLEAKEKRLLSEHPRDPSKRDRTER
jgi:hypothetical protein